MVAPFTVRTARLELIPGTLELTQAEINDRARFAALLHVAPVTDWPPPLNDADSMAYFAGYMAEHPDAIGFCVWYFVLVEGDTRTLIGNGGLKGLPDASGTAEIGYSLLEAYQGKGYGTEIVRGLVDWAFAQPGVHRLIAETLPELVPSIRVLEKNGFRHIGEGSEPGVIRLELGPPRR